MMSVGRFLRGGGISPSWYAVSMVANPATDRAHWYWIGSHTLPDSHAATQLPVNAFQLGKGFVPVVVHAFATHVPVNLFQLGVSVEQI